MKCLFDNNISKRLARAIAILSEERRLAERVLHLQELFPPGMADTSWMDRLGATDRSWVVVTRETNPHPAAARTPASARRPSPG
jgi:hypothetical protein